jgi:MFS family permease
MDGAGTAETVSTDERAETRFIRDSTTYLAYLSIAYLLFVESSLGPIMPSLRAQMGMSYTVASLHFSAPAFGGMMMGWSGDKIARRIGRRRTFWLGVIGITAGAALLVSGRWIPMTIAGALFIGGFGALISIVMQAYLADEYVNHRPKVMSEFNMAASFGAVLVAFVIGAAERTGLGWRAALVITSVLVALALFKMRNVPIGERMPYHVQRRGKSAPMPAVFWVCCRGGRVERRDGMGLRLLGGRFPASSRGVLDRERLGGDERLFHRDGFRALHRQPHRRPRQFDRRAGARVCGRHRRVVAVLVGAGRFDSRRRALPGRAWDRERLSLHRVARH